MSNKINHRRPKNKQKVDRRYSTSEYNNGHARNDGSERWRNGDLVAPDGVDESSKANYVGRTGYLYKGGTGWGQKTEFSDKMIGASVCHEYSQSHRGMAKAVRGAKKYIRTRVRFHENAATKKMMDNTDDE
jgi:hypothetical protein